MIDVYKNYLENCPVCGGDLSENDKDCPFCGANLLGYNKKENAELAYEKRLQKLGSARAVVGSYNEGDIQAALLMQSEKRKRNKELVNVKIGIAIAIIAVLVLKFLC